MEERESFSSLPLKHSEAHLINSIDRVPRSLYSAGTQEALRAQRPCLITALICGWERKLTAANAKDMGPVWACLKSKGWASKQRQYKFML